MHRPLEPLPHYPTVIPQLSHGKPWGSAILPPCRHTYFFCSLCFRRFVVTPHSSPLAHSPTPVSLPVPPVIRWISDHDSSSDSLFASFPHSSPYSCFCTPSLLRSHPYIDLTTQPLAWTSFVLQYSFLTLLLLITFISPGLLGFR